MAHRQRYTRFFTHTYVFADDGAGTSACVNKHHSNMARSNELLWEFMGHNRHNNVK